jgi:hypothetical protein
MPVQEARSVPKEAPVTAIREPSVELRGLPVPSFVKKPERVSLGLLEAIQEVKVRAAPLLALPLLPTPKPGDLLPP